MTLEDAKSSAYRAVEIGTKLTVGVLTALTLGLWADVKENRDRSTRNEERIQSVKDSQFTEGDASELLEAIRVIVRDEFEIRIQPIEEKITDVKTRLDRAEQR